MVEDVRPNGDRAHRVARRVWALAEEWSPALAELVGSRHDIPEAVCQELARMALAYVGVAALLAVAHTDEEPDCRRPGHPHACVAEAALDKALSQIPPHLSGSPLEDAYRDMVQEALALWRARVAPEAGAMVHAQQPALCPSPAPVPLSEPLPE